MRRLPSGVNHLSTVSTVCLPLLSMNSKRTGCFIYRDRMGIKPVYYYWDGHHLAFASELKALLELSLLAGRLTINKKAVSQFLYLGYIPRPNSIYQEIRKMDSGTYLVASENFLEEKMYWSLESQIQGEVITDIHYAKRELKKLILSAVEYRLISDVPSGIFLSGGVDSSMVTAAAAAVSSQRVNTFSIAFEDSKFNEADYARRVAKHLGTTHHELLLLRKILWSGLKS